MDADLDKKAIVNGNYAKEFIRIYGLIVIWYGRELWSEHCNYEL